MSLKAIYFGLHLIKLMFISKLCPLVLAFPRFRYFSADRLCPLALLCLVQFCPHFYTSAESFNDSAIGNKLSGVNNKKQTEGKENDIN